MALYYSFPQHKNLYDSLCDRYRDEIEAEQSLLATVEQETKSGMDVKLLAH